MLLILLLSIIIISSTNIKQSHYLAAPSLKGNAIKGRGILTICPRIFYYLAKLLKLSLDKSNIAARP